ncbi:MAG: universal stress protein [Pseudomonadota bacterium]
MTSILVTTDLGRRSDIAMLRAARLAAQMALPLHILHVADDDLPAALLQRRSEEAEGALAEMVRYNPALADLSPRIDVEVGEVVKRVTDMADRHDPALLVLGSHRGRGLGELLGTPTLQRIVKSVEAPILVAVGPAEADYATAAVGWDHSAASRIAFDLTRQVAPDATIRLIHAWHDPYAVGPYGLDGGATSNAIAREREAEIQKTAETLAAEGVTVRGEAVMSGPANALLRAADDGSVDLLSVGRHARSGIARFLLGSTAARVVLYAPCDVLIAPAE